MDTHKPAPSGFWWIASASIAGVLVLWVLLGWFASTQSRPGDFGDMFGASNALFAGLAFAILIATLHSQREELALQRQELAESRQIFIRQQFEDTFFQLVALHDKVTDNLELRPGAADYRRGRACFPELLQRLNDTYQRSDIPETDDERRLITACVAFYRDVEYMLGPYFRVMYNVLRYVDESRMADKKIYANLVRAQLSSHELALLFYSATFHPQGVGMRKYLGRYNLLKHLPAERLIKPTHREWMSAATRAG